MASRVESALGLTAAEHFALARFMTDSSRERSGAEPWQRSWHGAHNAADGRVFASLARKGLIESKPGPESPRYRWRSKP
jgi:hypothetical protein